MKVCFFLGGFHQNGGIGRITAMLANHLIGLDEIQITALCYCNPKLQNIYQLAPEIRQEFFLQSYSSMLKQLACGGFLRLRKYLVENDIDVLVACGALFYPISVLACKKIKTKCICWEHSDPEGNNDHRGQYIARKFGIKKSDLNVVLTKRALQTYKEKYRADKTIQVYNPVDKAVFAAAGDYDPESKKIISVGRLTYQKNFQMAVKIASAVLPAYPDWEWDVFGQGEDLEDLIKLTQQYGIDKQLHFRGQVSDLYDRYKEYSFMVMTSRYEGFPMTLLEGCGNALPLVSFDIPTGPSEIIDDGENGYLLTANDYDGMVKCIVRLIENTEERKMMSVKSRKKSEIYRIEDVCNAWYQVLQMVTGNERN